jgi:hypothetical protein
MKRRRGNNFLAQVRRATEAKEPTTVEPEPEAPEPESEEWEPSTPEVAAEVYKDQRDDARTQLAKEQERRRAAERRVDSLEQRGTLADRLRGKRRRPLWR